MESNVQEDIQMRSLSNSKVMKRPLLDVTVDNEELPPVVVVGETRSTTNEIHVAETVTINPHLPDGVKSSTTRAALNTVKSIIGVGILSFPYAFMNAGLVRDWKSICFALTFFFFFFGQRYLA
jgi:hypothetical protein